MVMSLFALTGRVVVVTGAAGILGRQHALAIASAGGVPVLLDVNSDGLRSVSMQLNSLGYRHAVYESDVTEAATVANLSSRIRHEVGPVWGLVNNVAANPPMGSVDADTSRMETYPIEQWDADLRLGLSAAFLCAREFGQQMASEGSGSIVNVASDLALIAPDQRIYRHGVEPSGAPPVKPVSYSVTKAGLLGLTRYLATYWAPVPVRCNAPVPGSVGGTQTPEMVAELEHRIPLGRLATPAEYQGGLVFLLSDATAYMTGAILVMDGGRTVW